MLEISPVTLTGRYFLLEPLQRMHFPELISAANHPELWQYSWPSNQFESAIMEKYLDARLQFLTSLEELPLTIIERQSGKIVGATAFQSVKKRHYGLEIGGTWLTPAFQNTLANTEAKYLMLKQAFEEWFCVRIEMRADPQNLKSVKAIERIGAKYEGLLRSCYIREGQCVDFNVYSIIKDEWITVKQHLETLLETSVSKP